jgi:hypothetical protein
MTDKEREAGDSRDSGTLEFFPVTFGAYDHHEPLDTDTEAAQLMELLSEFGGKPNIWQVPAAERGADALDERLAAWSTPEESSDTFLYWAGHGEGDGRGALLAHARSPKPLTAGGISPQELMRRLAARQAHRHGAGRWAIVVVDACKSARFVELMAAEALTDPHGPRDFLLVATSRDGIARLGAFRRALTDALKVTFRAEDTIDLRDLGTELSRNLDGCPVIPHTVTGRAVLRRTVPALAATLTTSLDLLDEIEEALAGLSEDERRHFAPKASGAELGEQAWYFEGREAERHRVFEWLEQT